MMNRHSLALSRNILLQIYNETNPWLLLNDAKVQLATTHKHLILILDFRLDFI